MALFSQKTISKGHFLTVLTVLMSFLVNIAVPCRVKAEVAPKEFVISQKGSVFYNFPLDLIKKGKKVDLAEEVDIPDKVVSAVLTAYTSTVDQCDASPFTAASGKRVYDGMIAANGLPFGTKIKIPSLYGDKIFTVDDRMHPRYGFGRFDVWLDAKKADAKKFGVKRVKVEIYYPELVLAR